jgi:hypothetical protein
MHRWFYILMPAACLVAGCSHEPAQGLESSTGQSAGNAADVMAHAPVEQPNTSSSNTGSNTGQLQRGRPVILFARDPASPLLAQQLELLGADPAGLKERMVTVTRIISDQGHASATGTAHNPSVTRQFQSQFNVDPEEPFLFILVGKDGGVKLRSRQVVGLDQLYGLIDSMPMRQREIRQSRNQAGANPKE